MASFNHPDGGTILYHASWGGAVLAVGDPLAEESQMEPLLDAFLREYPSANFVQCSESLGRRLLKRGYLVNSFGVETDLVLSRWNSSGKRAHMLRKNFNKADRMGVNVIEITEDLENLKIARTISDSWLRANNQSSHELRLLTRPPVFSPEPGTRKFASMHEGRMIGIGFFDPLCLAHPESGYVYQLLRESPDAPVSTRTHLLLTVAEKFRAAGVERLSLGLSPNSLAPTEPLKHSKWTRRLLALSRRWRWYNYQGQEFYKSRFGGDEITVFLATRSRFALPLLLRLAFQTGIIQTSWGQWFKFGSNGNTHPSINQ